MFKERPRGKMRNLLYLAISLFFLSGCSASLKMSPIASEGQDTFFEKGTESLRSTKKAIVELRPVQDGYKSEERNTFAISVYNATHNPFKFSTNNILASVNGQRLKVYSYEELVSEVMNECITTYSTLSKIYPTAGDIGYQKCPFDKTLLETRETILKEQVVIPQTWHRGFVKVGKNPFPERDNKIIIAVSVAEEDHRFVFSEAKTD